MADADQPNAEAVGITFGGFDPSGEGVMAVVHERTRLPDGTYDHASLPPLLIGVAVLRQLYELFPQLGEKLEQRAHVGQALPPLADPLPPSDSGPAFTLTGAQAYCAEIGFTRALQDIDAVEFVLVIRPFAPKTAAPQPRHFVLPTWAVSSLEHAIGQLLERHASTRFGQGQPATARPVAHFDQPVVQHIRVDELVPEVAGVRVQFDTKAAGAPADKTRQVEVVIPYAILESFMKVAPQILKDLEPLRQALEADGKQGKTRH